MKLQYIENCFPIEAKNDALYIFNNFDFNEKYPIFDPFNVVVAGSDIAIPTRMYADDVQLKLLSNFSEIQQEMLLCLFTRHHSGYVREKCLQQIISSQQKFVVPYILELLGDYVIEIVNCIYQNRVSLKISMGSDSIDYIFIR